jgi:hypothetical protein
MRFAEHEIDAILHALDFTKESFFRTEESNRLRQRITGITAESRAHCARKVAEYRARREALEALISRFEYISGREAD